jgi:hypothetical protein
VTLPAKANDAEISHSEVRGGGTLIAPQGRKGKSISPGIKKKGDNRKSKVKERHGLVIIVIVIVRPRDVSHAAAMHAMHA